MKSELPNIDELKKQREGTEKKIADAKAKKIKDIEDRMRAMGEGRNETRKFYGLLTEANEIFEYYNKLQETGQLPENELDNLENARRTVEEIQAKIDEIHEGTKKTMAIPEVNLKVAEEAEAENNKYKEREKKEKKEKAMEEKFYQWYEKLVGLAEKFNQGHNLKLDEIGEAKENLTKKIDKTIPVEWAKKEIKETINSIKQFEDRFSDKVEEYKKDLSWFELVKKNKVNSLINSNELGQMRAAIENLNKFLEDNDFKGYGYIGRELGRCVYAILDKNNKGMTQELNDLFNLCDERPEVSAKYFMEKAYKKGGNRFEEAWLAPDNIDLFRKRFDENSRREEQKK